MTGHEEGEGWNLTGVWHGQYTYPYGSAPVSFVATIIESRTLISGSTHEDHGLEPRILYATLSGRREGRAVTFRKICESDGSDGYGSPIDYEGTLSEDGTEIEGRWAIPSMWSGKFLMIRSGGKTNAVAQKKFQEA